MKSLATSLAGFLLTPGLPRSTRRGLRVAMSAVLSSAVLFGASGCLAPQWIEGELPATNQPMTYDESQVEPTAVNVCLSDDSPFEFRLNAIEDPDGATGQKLRVRWFLDWTPETTLPRTVGLERELSTDAGATVYPAAVLKSDRIPKTDLGAPGTVHSLDVVISDGFDPDDTQAPAGRAVAEGAYSISHRWFFTYQGATGCL